MTACPCSNEIRRSLGRAGLALALLTSVAPGALALSGEPTQLGVPQVTTDPATTEPAPWPPPATTPAPGSGSGGGIEASPLPPMQPAPVPAGQVPAGQLPAEQVPPAMPGTTQPGVLAVPGATPTVTPAATPAVAPAPAATGYASLGSDLWQGSEVSRLMGMVPRLPAPVTVPSLRDLQVRVLVSDAPSDGAAPGLDPLQSLRADKLYQMGFNDAALGLTRNAAAPAAPANAQEAVEFALKGGDDAAACQQVDAVLAGGQALDDYFRRAVIFCQILREQNDAASLGLGLMREMGSDDATTKDFVALAALANGETKRKPKLGATPDGLNTALMKMAGIAAPGADAAPTPVGPGGALLIARDASRPLPERLKAAEEAFRTGLLPAAEMGEIYMQVPAGNADPATTISMSDSAEVRAQLYQEARRAMQPERRAKAIDAAMKKAQQRGDYLNQAQLYMGLTTEISPSREMSWFAPQAARLSFLAGHPDKGGYWLNTVAANPTAFGKPGEREGLELLGRIAGLTGTAQNDPVAAWRQASGTQNARVDLLYALLSGVGAPASGEIVGNFPVTPVATPGSTSVEIAAAASGNRKGETILLSLNTIGGDRAIAADPASLSTALRSLAAVGYASEARRIASEIAILAGL
jgi:hypothetical protein